MRVIAASCLIAATTAGLLTSCGDHADDGRTIEVRGTAVVTDGATRSVLHGGRHRVPVDAVVRVTRGRAVLDLAGDATAELRSGVGSVADSRLRVAATPALLDGEALVVNGQPVRLAVGDLVVALGDGASRLRNTASATVGVYAGRARIDAHGRRVTVPAFRQLTVAGTAAVPRRPVPFVYDQRNPDPWDRRFLGVAIDLGEQLDRRSLALSRQLTPPTTDAAYVASLLPALRRQRAFGDALVSPSRALGETLVGASIALESPARDFGRGWSRVFGFRSDGARWGLVAVAQRARRGPLVAQLDALLDEAPPRLAAPVVGGITTTTTTARPRRPGGAGSSPTTSAPAQPPIPTAPAVAVPPVSVPPTTVPSPGGSATTVPPTTVPATTLPPTTVPALPPPPPVVAPIQKLLDDTLRILGL